MSDIPQSLHDRILATPFGGTLEITLADATALMSRFPSDQGFSVPQQLGLYQRCTLLGRTLVYTRRKQYKKLK